MGCLRSDAALFNRAQTRGILRLGLGRRSSLNPCPDSTLGLKKETTAAAAFELRRMDVQLMGFTQAGKVVILPCQDLAKVQDSAESKVQHGEWRTWDAFEAPRDDGRPRKLVASHKPGTTDRA